MVVTAGMMGVDDVVVDVVRIGVEEVVEIVDEVVVVTAGGVLVEMMVAGTREEMEVEVVVGSSVVCVRVRVVLVVSVHPLHPATVVVAEDASLPSASASKSEKRTRTYGPLWWKRDHPR